MYQNYLYIYIQIILTRKVIFCFGEFGESPSKIGHIAKKEFYQSML